MSIRYFDLERWQRQMSANRMRIEALILASPSGKAASTGWNAAQCLLHLDLTANAFLSQRIPVSMEPGFGSDQSLTRIELRFMVALVSPQHRKSR